MSELGQLLIVDDDRPFAAELMANAQKLDLTVKLVHDAPAFEQTPASLATHHDRHGFGYAELRRPGADPNLQP